MTYNLEISFLNTLKIYISVLFLVFGLEAHSQSSQPIFHVQAVVSFGSTVSKVGVKGIAEYRHLDVAEGSIGYGISRNFNNYGPDIPHWEHQVFASGHYLWGDRDYIKSDLPYVQFLDSGESGNSAGYTFERFFNRIGTSQNVGTIHFRTENVYYHFSNDVFANTTGDDRFRTGAFGFGYIEGDSYYSLKMLIWTGDSRCKGVRKVRDSDYPARWGYRDNTDCKYGKFSHGILSFGYHHNMGYGQTVGGDVGLDSERIRNYVQNKIFHDMYFLPRAINSTKNLHLPMKAQDGESYMYKEDQQIRKDLFYWQLSTNPTTLY